MLFCERYILYLLMLILHKLYHLEARQYINLSGIFCLATAIQILYSQEVVNSLALACFQNPLENAISSGEIIPREPEPPNKKVAL